MNKPIQSVLDVPAKVGVLLYDSTTEVNTILADTVERLRARRLTVGGLLQRSGDRLPNGKRGMLVDEIATGRTIRLDQPRGPGAVACILDPDALAQAACLLRRTIDSQPDVIVVNRFGTTEADGGGLRAEIAEAICSGAVVLIAVRSSRLADLEQFLGCTATLLSPSAAAIADWVEHAASRQLATVP